MRIINTTLSFPMPDPGQTATATFPAPAEGQTHWHIPGVGYFTRDGAFMGTQPPQLIFEHPLCTINDCGWCFALAEIARQDHARGTCSINPDGCSTTGFDERQHYCPLHRCAAMGHTPRPARDGQMFCILCLENLPG